MVKNKLNKKLGRVGAGLLSALLIAGTYSTKTVYADDNKVTTVEKENTLPVIEVSQQDLNPLDTIKSLVIQERAAFDGTYDLTNISIEKSVADIEGFNRSVTGIQTVTVKVTLASTGDIEAQKTLGYSFIQKAVVNVVNSTAPVIKLKNSSVVVNNGDTFNASSYISYINDDSGILPVLTVEGTVDMNTDGDYPVTYTVVDTAGNKSTATMTVFVRTPQEVVDAKIAAEEQRQREREERQRREQEEWERRFKAFNEYFSNQGGFYTGYQGYYQNSGTSYDPYSDFKNKFENACRVLEFNTYDIDFYQVKLQYRKLAKKYHPDLNIDRDTTEKFQEINSAFEFLTEENIKRYNQMKR